MTGRQTRSGAGKEKKQVNRPGYKQLVFSRQTNHFRLLFQQQPPLKILCDF
jgi:hypothetical protein